MGMFNKDGNRRPVLNTGPGLTKQSFKDEVNINKIIARYEKTGMIELLNEKQPFYGDVSELRGYKEALDLVGEADELFMKLSPEIRTRFENDPGKLIEFLDDVNNHDEAVKLGIVSEKPAEEVIPENKEVVK